MVSEPSSLDSVRANKKAGADDNSTGGDKRPEVLTHLPGEKKILLGKGSLEKEKKTFAWTRIWFEKSNNRILIRGWMDYSSHR